MKEIKCRNEGRWRESEMKSPIRRQSNNSLYILTFMSCLLPSYDTSGFTEVYTSSAVLVLQRSLRTVGKLRGKSIEGERK